ncbi:hypothetical protein AAFC00_003537 [Neodothiora populina]|uniref:DUF1740-domain-containing protein n=1 Tax=Neodothiora populina TaxID=2781224 RepID=A0ABR3PEJ8_9PEZI
MSEQGKPPIPKFYTYKGPAKRNLGPSLVNEIDSASKRRRTASPDRESRQGDRHASHRRHHHRHHGHRSREHHDSEHHQHKSSIIEARPSVIRPSDYVSPVLASDLYTIDRKGDVQNWTYQRLHKYSIPHYRRIGYGRILGLQGYKIDPELSVEDRVYLIDTRHNRLAQGPRAFSKKPTRQQLPELRISAHVEDQTLDPSTDFISLTARRHARKSSKSALPSDTLDAVRSLQNSQPSLSPPPDTDLEYASSENEDAGFDLETRVRHQNAELSREARLNPSNLQAWLDLAAHQIHLVRSTTSVTLDDLSDGERRTLADLRLHIYEKASKSIPLHDKKARESIFQSMFEEAFLLWDLPKYLQRLEDAIKELPGSYVLWTLALNAVQTEPAQFSFEHGKRFFVESLRKIAPIQAAGRETTSNEVEDMRLYILLRYATYLRECGYEEMSIALWQAIIEFHLFSPRALSLEDTKPALESFEEFWESEVPRFGEDGAQGWCNYSTEFPIIDGPTRPACEQRLQRKQPFRSFAQAERGMVDNQRFPAKSSDEDSLKDPFRIVLYSDIQECLVSTSAPTSSLGLIDAFLCYLGLPARKSLTKTKDHSWRVRTWRADPFLCRGLIDDSTAANVTKKATEVSVTSFETTTQTLFPSITHAEQMSKPNAIHHFIRTSLASMVQQMPDDDDLAEYYLAFVYRYYSKDAAKTARGILKQRSSSLRLYNACALIESNLGRVEKASKIWTGAVKMVPVLTADAQQEAVLLWHSWAWHEMERGTKDAALARLVFYDASAGQDVSHAVTSPAMLRATKMYREGFEHAVSQRNAHLASLNAECLASMAYLKDRDALEVAMALLDEHIEAVNSTRDMSFTNLTLELLHQVKARMIAYHIKRAPYKPSFVRSQLEESMTLFPKNSIFLWLYKDNESRFRIDDRVRAVLRNTATDEKAALVRASFEIDQEMSRLADQVSGTTVESVRAAFSKALLPRGSHLRHCRDLWTRWFCFEEQILRRGLAGSHGTIASTQSAIRRLKSVYLSGLHNLPWVKDWILLGLESFDKDQSCGGWASGDLIDLYNMLDRRQLRIRVTGIEDYWNA